MKLVYVYCVATALIVSSVVSLGMSLRAEMAEHGEGDVVATKYDAQFVEEIAVKHFSRTDAGRGSGRGVVIERNARDVFDREVIKGYLDARLDDDAKLKAKLTSRYMTPFEKVAAKYRIRYTPGYGKQDDYEYKVRMLSYEGEDDVLKQRLHSARIKKEQYDKLLLKELDPEELPYTKVTLNEGVLTQVDAEGMMAHDKQVIIEKLNGCTLNVPAIRGLGVLSLKVQTSDFLIKEVRRGGFELSLRDLGDGLVVLRYRHKRFGDDAVEVTLDSKHDYRVVRQVSSDYWGDFHEIEYAGFGKLKGGEEVPHYVVERYYMPGFFMSGNESDERVLTYEQVIHVAEVAYGVEFDEKEFLPVIPSGSWVTDMREKPSKQYRQE